MEFWGEIQHYTEESGVGVTNSDNEVERYGFFGPLEIEKQSLWSKLLYNEMNRYAWHFHESWLNLLGKEMFFL